MAQEIRLRRAQNRNTISNKDRKREKLSTGVIDSQDSNNFKDKRKNAKENNINKLCFYMDDEDKKICSQAKDNACGDSGIDVS